jgi:hypothetical protein
VANVPPVLGTPPAFVVPLVVILPPVLIKLPVLGAPPAEASPPLAEELGLPVPPHPIAKAGASAAIHNDAVRFIRSIPIASAMLSPGLFVRSLARLRHRIRSNA